jgi:RNA polymerase sigma factor (sigma-70 family)
MELYERYGPALVRKAQRMLGSRADAEDVVHTLFLGILERGDETADLPYLFRATTNRCLNYLRDEKNRRRILDGYDMQLRGPTRTLCEDTIITGNLLMQAIDRLDKAGAELFVYYYLDDMRQEEIAQVTGISRKTIGKRLAALETFMRDLVPCHQGGAS